ncbi:hypothetical protein HJG60_008833 [Phyllostomus discolor]|uniref:Uncharacterized protein n=1 Tax=Phyllostomus discolor TaxID=89673 RepID=A0A833YZH7_9CHIR|nr:hypothetical protein HJG60_008833 [Phyllostomus discolor]
MGVGDFSCTDRKGGGGTNVLGSPLACWAASQGPWGSEQGLAPGRDPADAPGGANPLGVCSSPPSDARMQGGQVSVEELVSGGRTSHPQWVALLMTSQCRLALGRRPTQHQLGPLSLSLGPPHPPRRRCRSSRQAGTESQGPGREVGAPPHALWVGQWGPGPCRSQRTSGPNLTSRTPLTQGSRSWGFTLQHPLPLCLAGAASLSQTRSVHTLPFVRDSPSAGTVNASPWET